MSDSYPSSANPPLPTADQQDGTHLPAEGLLRWFCRQNLRWLLGGAAAGIAWRLTIFLIPLFVGLAIDRGLQREDIGATNRWAAAAFGAAILVAVFDACRHWCADTGYYAALADMRSRLFGHLQARDLRWHSRHGVGKLLGSFNSDLPHFAGFIAEFPTAVAAALMLLVTTVALFVIDPVLGLIALITLPAVIAVVAVAGPGVHGRANDLQGGTAAVTETVEESLENIVLVKSFGLEDARIAALDRVGDRLVTNAVAYERTQATLLGAAGLIPAAAIGAGLLIGGERVIAGRMSLGELVAFTTWMALYATIVETLVQRASGFIRLAAAVRRVEALLADAPMLPGLASPEAPAATGTLAFHGVTLEDAGRPVLTATDIAMPHGSRVLVTGPSGSGKSALLALLARQCDPTSGSVTWGGRDLRDLDLVGYRRRVALVSESAFLFDATVRDNLMLSRPEASAADIQESLRLASALDITASLPEGLDTAIGATGRDLSGGQRQRLALARALLSRPSVLLVDDALSAVDAATEQAILGNLERWDGTIVFATHRPNAIRDERLLHLTVTQGEVLVLPPGREGQPATPGMRHVAPPGVTRL